MIKKFFRDHYIHKKVAPKLDIFFILPIINLFFIWGTLTLGMAAAQIHIIGYPQNPLQFGFNQVILFFSMSLVYSSIILMDSKVNLIEPDKYRIFFPDLTILPERSISIFIRLMQIISILLAAIIHFSLSIVYVMLIIGYLNYNKRINKEQWSIIDFMIINTITYIIFFTIGWFFVIHQSNLSDYYLVNFLKIIIGYIFSFISLIFIVYVKEFDFNSTFKDRRIMVGSTILLIIASIISLLNNDPILSIISITLIPFYLYGVFRFSDKDITRIVRYSIFMHIFFCFTIYPLFCIPYIFGFYISKYYYWHRYDIHFPAFAID